MSPFGCAIISVGWLNGPAARSASHGEPVQPVSECTPRCPSCISGLPSSVKDLATESERSVVYTMPFTIFSPCGSVTSPVPQAPGICHHGRTRRPAGPCAGIQIIGPGIGRHAADEAELLAVGEFEKIAEPLVAVVACANLGHCCVPPGDEARTVGLSPLRLARLDEVMKRRYVDSGYLPGILTQVCRKGELVHTGMAGHMDIERDKPMREDAIFRIYSMTKPITAVALMMLVEEGADRPRRRRRTRISRRGRTCGVYASGMPSLVADRAAPVHHHAGRSGR